MAKPVSMDNVNTSNGSCVTYCRTRMILQESAMSKEVQMTIRIEPALRAEFTEAAMRDHRPASQVLRELMRSYIKTVGEKNQVATNTSTAMPR